MLLYRSNRPAQSWPQGAGLVFVTAAIELGSLPFTMAPLCFCVRALFSRGQENDAAVMLLALL